MADGTNWLKEPIKYAVYKGMGGKHGAAQFSLIRFDPNRMHNGKPNPKGGVLLEMAPTTGKNVYDWEGGKISFWMSVEDISEFLILRNFDKDSDDNEGIFHSFNETNKKLRIGKGSIYKGLPSWLMSLHSSVKGGESKTVSLPISAKEMTVLVKLLEAAIPSILGWNTLTEGV